MGASSSNNLAVRILMGLGIGAALGAVVAIIGSPKLLDSSRAFATQVCDPVGRVFLGLLFFVVVPLVFASLALGIVQLGRLDRLGPLAGRTFALFGLNMAISVTLGLVIMNVVRPGGRIDAETRDQLLTQFQQGATDAKTQAAAAPRLSFSTLVDMFFPRNLARAVVDFQLLPLIAFAMLVGIAGTQLPESERLALQRVLQLICDLMTRIVHYALTLGPYAVAAMVFSVAVKLGIEFFLGKLLVFVLCVLGGISLHLFITLPILVKFLGGRSPREVFRAIATVLVTAFSTSSSSATLPTSIRVTRDDLGVSPSTAGFVLPLGATMNMAGTALYEGCVVLFVAQVFGGAMPLGQQLVLVVLAVLSAVAVAGIPGGSLPLIVGLLANFGLPPEGIAIVIGIDRLLDMSRTVLNVAADIVTAVIVDRQTNAANTPAGTPDPAAS
ncbi:MAG: dicarboxylate/amino acid:cation symporter [Limisphaerales bacterium]